MSKAIGATVLAALIGLTGYATYTSYVDKKTETQKIQQENEIITINGLISLDVEDFFNDSRVIDILKKEKISVNFKKVGSRDMPDQLMSQSYDFAFPSGVVAGNKIKEALKVKNIDYSDMNLFYSPMIIGSYQDTADILVANSIASNQGNNIYVLDMSKLIPLIKDKKKWSDLKDNSHYNFNKSILVYTTDIKKSNSSAMYLALASYIENGNDVVTDNITAEKIATTMTGLYKRQGYQENYVSGNFDDYKQGVGKSPLAFIYEFQMYRYAMTNKKLKSGMVVMYPSPTIVNKEVFISLTKSGKKLSDLLNTHSQLQAIAVEYGFRTNSDSNSFIKAAQRNGLNLQEEIKNQIDPPSFDIMKTMINTVTTQLN